jgi:hypothetical protein
MMKCACGYDTGIVQFGPWADYKGKKHFDLLCYCESCSKTMTRDVLKNTQFKSFNRCPTCKRKTPYYGVIKDRSHGAPIGLAFDCDIGSNHKYYLKNVNQLCPDCGLPLLKIIHVG